MTKKPSKKCQTAVLSFVFGGQVFSQGAFWSTQRWPRRGKGETTEGISPLACKPHHLGPPLERLWDAFGRPWDAFGTPLGCVGDALGRLWTPLGRLWDALGRLWDALGTPLGRLGDASGPPLGDAAIRDPNMTKKTIEKVPNCSTVVRFWRVVFFGKRFLAGLESAPKG